MFTSLPATFLPDEDQGALFLDIQLPDAASLDRTRAIMDQVQTTLQATEGVENVIAVAGFSILQGTLSPNGAMVVAALKPWEERRDAGAAARRHPGKLRAQFSTIPGRQHRRLCAAGHSGHRRRRRPRPAAAGAAGSAAGRDRPGRARLRAGRINQQPEIGGVASTFSADVPQIFVDVDRTRAEALGRERLRHLFDDRREFRLALRQ